ncbi:hypothetical protein BOTBODRAFT_581460 [Botryobasidium botryosum FD-172 SS1]|uniref:Uncharacterized protein n=1 Tax=Botryobasidium botryosum (strain FD-172 SS1) TaxID=930990 RepID=A0A067N1R3_BOTB1|nr:hypothetical protein BOTBODRAFT_581460 [Botryobasidium botryosum FD-172 SS1]
MLQQQQATAGSSTCEGGMDVGRIWIWIEEPGQKPAESNPPINLTELLPPTINPAPWRHLLETTAKGRHSPVT